MKRIILTLTLALFTLPILNAQDIKLNGTTSAESNQIKNVADPTDNQDAGTKAYIDALISDLQDQIAAMQASTGSGTVTDQDGNSYPYLTYGDQIWTVKNAEVVTYRDGTTIPQITDATEWSNLTTGAWCYYNNDPTKPRKYNWYAVMGIHDTDPNTPNKAFAPEGWHVPSDAEWTTLENYLMVKGYNYDGTASGNKIAKAMASTTGWDSSTTAGGPANDQSTNNSSGFNALPEGYRYHDGFSYDESYYAFFWSSTENNTGNAWSRYLYYSDSNLGRTSDVKRDGSSVRFVRGFHPNYIDNDNDGFTENQGDCNDTDASTYPGATELADGKDNDCDGEIDEDLETFDLPDAPTYAAADVISIFSDVYENIPVDFYNGYWQPYQTTTSADFDVNGDNILSYENFNFVGHQFGSPTVDASQMTHFHFDVFIPGSLPSDAKLKVTIKDFGADGADGNGDDTTQVFTLTSADLTGDAWSSIDIPLSLSPKSKIGQLIYQNDGTNVTALYLDNVYFYKN